VNKFVANAAPGGSKSYARAFNIEPAELHGMAKKLKAGDKVSWNTSQGRTTGKVVKKLTRATHVKTHKVAASEAEPEYLVESSKSGKRAAHKKSALNR
jgi:Hypervirulence associated proteins TUDOR domain